MFFQDLNTVPFTKKGILIQDIFTILYFLHFGFFLGVMCVAWIHTYVGNEDMNDLMDYGIHTDETTIGNKGIPYEKKYLIDSTIQKRVNDYYETYSTNEKGKPFKYKNEIYENMLKHLYDEDKRASIEKLSIIENTPDGMVIMKYCFDTLGFIYYSNSKQIQNKYLNAVAIKFVSVFHCYELFINNENTYTTYVNDDIDSSETETDSNSDMDISETDSEMDNDNDNETDNETNGTNKTTIEDKKETLDSVFFVSKENKEKQQKMENIIHTQILKNKFKYIGTLNDFNFLQTSTYNELYKDNRKIDYSYFKSLLGEKVALDETVV